MEIPSKVADFQKYSVQVFPACACAKVLLLGGGGGGGGGKFSHCAVKPLGVLQFSGECIIPWFGPILSGLIFLHQPLQDLHVLLKVALYMSP